MKSKSMKMYQPGGAVKKAAKKMTNATADKMLKSFRAGSQGGQKIGMKKGMTRGVLAGAAGTAAIGAGTYGAATYGMKLDDARRKAEAAKKTATKPAPKQAPKLAPKSVAKSDTTSAKRGPAQMKRGGMMKMRRK